MGNVAVVLQHLFFHVVVFFTRTLHAFQHSQTLHHARFASFHELTSLLSSTWHGTGLLLGVSHLSHVLRVRPTAARRELGNMLIVAPTRGGKGLLATSQLLTWRHSVIVNDIKGDLYDQTAGYRSTLGKVYVIDPTGRGNRFDPLLGKHTEDELLSSATHLLYKPDEGEGAIFTQRATVMLTQLFLAARMEGLPPLPSVRHMIRTGLQDTADSLNAINPDIATQFLDVRYEGANFTDRFLLSAWGTLTARMRPLLTETVICSLTKADFSPKDLMHSETPITVYLRWTERDLLALSPLVRLMWGTLIDGLITTYDKAQGKNCQPILVLIDEAGRTAIPSLADHATTVVGRGISLWIAVQSLSQLDAVYGKTRATVLRDNMETQLFYRPSNQETADYLQHCLGRRSDYARSETLREGTETSEGRTEQGIPLMTSQDIKQLEDEDIIGFHRLLPPFRAKRIDWRNFPALVHRQAMPPPQLAMLPLLDDWFTDSVLQRTERFPNGYINPDI